MFKIDEQIQKLGLRFGCGIMQAVEGSRGRSSAAGSETRNIKSLREIPSVWQLDATLNWVVPDLIAEGSVNLLSCESGTGKTWVAYFLAGAVAHGGGVFGKVTDKRKVVYFDGENPLFVVKDRLRQLGIAETPSLTIWGGWCPDPPPGPNHPLVQDCALKDRPLLIWDSLVEFHPGDEQSSTETRKFMRHFRRLANAGASVLILHHTGKADTSKDYRGSSDIKAVVDMAYKLTPVGDSETLDKLTLTTFKSRFGAPVALTMQFVEGEGFTRCEAAGGLAKTIPPFEHVRAIVAQKPGLNQSEIVKLAQARGVAKNKVEAALKDPLFESRPGQGNAHLYYLKPPEQEREAENLPTLVPARFADQEAAA